jgi:hypothetical protein
MVNSIKSTEIPKITGNKYSQTMETLVGPIFEYFEGKGLASAQGFVGTFHDRLQFMFQHQGFITLFLFE